jgi:hypothetical protein
MEMFGGVLVLRRIATAYMAAGSAETKVDPVVAHLETFFAAVCFRFHGVNLIHVGALTHIRSSI